MEISACRRWLGAEIAVLNLKSLYAWAQPQPRSYWEEISALRMNAGSSYDRILRHLCWPRFILLQFCVPETYPGENRWNPFIADLAKVVVLRKMRTIA